MIYLLYYTLFNLILISFCSSSGVLAWGTVTTIALILIFVKRLLRTGCKCTCERRRYRNPGDVEDPTTQPRTVPPAEHHSTSLETIAVHLHTPPSQATTPETSSLASTPDTIVKALQVLSSSEFDTLVDTPRSAAPLINSPADDHVSSNTRSKTRAKRKL